MADEQQVQEEEAQQEFPQQVSISLGHFGRLSLLVQDRQGDRAEALLSVDDAIRISAQLSALINLIIQSGYMQQMNEVAHQQRVHDEILRGTGL